jgi:alpha-tubulin suppressor-like RCC1 family protein
LERLSVSSCPRIDHDGLPARASSQRRRSSPWFVALVLLASACAQTHEAPRKLSGTEGLLVLAPGWVTGTTWPTETVVALNSIAARSTSLVNGDLAVITSASAVLSGTSELSMSTNAEITGNVRVDSIDMQSSAHVYGNASYNQLTGYGAIDGVKNASLTLPVPITVVAAANFTAGTTAITCAAGSTTTQSAGSFGTVTVNSGTGSAPTILRLGAGTYNFSTITMGDYARIECTGACQIDVKNRVAVGNHSYIGPGSPSSTSLTMDMVKLFVEGANGVATPGGLPAAMSLGTRSQLDAFTFVPNGTLVFGPSCSGVGKFIAMDVDIGTDVELMTGASTQRVILNRYIVGPSWPNEVITAFNSLDVTTGTTVTGDSAVIANGAGPYLNTSQAVLGANSTLTGNLRAGTVELKTGAKVTGALSYNTLTNAGSAGTLVTPVSLPLDIRAPVFPVITTGSSNKSIAARVVTTLAAGRYRNLTLTAGVSGSPTTLSLTGGVYELRSISMGDYCTLQCTAACEIRVSGAVTVGNNAIFGAAAGIDPSNVKVFAYNNTGSSPGTTPFAASFGTSNQVSAFLFAPRGTLATNTSTVLKGRFIARDIRLGGSSTNQRAGTTELAPTIKTQPVGGLVVSGQSVTYSVVASGTDIAFQWLRNGTPIAGATSGVYTLSSVSAADSGASFTVVVSNGVGSVTSAAAVLTVGSCDPMTYVPIATACGVGACARTGMQTCVAGSFVNSCAPGAPAANDTTCNGIDDNCNGKVDDGYVSVATTCAMGACAAMGSTSCVGGVVKDSCVGSVPAANDRTCDGRDDDCDGRIDEEYVPAATACGVGACGAVGVTSCVGGGIVDSCTPKAPGSSDTTCNGIDDDCNGDVDDGYVSVSTNCGTGACKSTGVTDCVAGAVVDSCHAGTNAPSDPTCDGVDDDCDGKVDENYAPTPTTCGVGACAATGTTLCVSGNVQNGCVAGTPAASDTTCNGIDDNCNGMADEGYVALPTSCGVGACAATGVTSCVAGAVQNSCHAGTPGSSDTTCNGIDDNCNGMADEGYVALPTSCGVGACAATGVTSCVSGAVQNSCHAGTPAASDTTCNGVDDNCNGTVDEGYAPLPTSCGVGACAATGVTSCVSGAVQNSCHAGTPAASDTTCNAVDDNCNGTVDEGYVALATSCGVGACAATGVTSCVSGAVQNSCHAGTPAASDTTCNGVDDNCNGTADEGYAPLPTSCGVGACAATGVTSCVSGAVQNSCHAGTPAASDTTCNGVDDNCNGSVDEGYVSLATSCGSGTCTAAGATSCVSGAVQNSCVAPSADADHDGTPDCADGCPNDPVKIAPQTCGCGRPDTDTDGDGVKDCLDNCPNAPNPGQQDTDGDHIGDACDAPLLLSIAAGGAHACAVLQDAEVGCWGSNASGQLGNGTTVSAIKPVVVSSLLDAQEVATGFDHSCARRASGAVVCWGNNANGQLGNNSTTASNVPVNVSGLVDAVQITAGHGYSCALRATGAVMCWGANDTGQLGSGTKVASKIPVAVTGVADAVQVAAGYGHACVLRSTGAVGCWGSNTNGQLGNGTKVASTTPVVVAGLSGMVQVAAGDLHACAIGSTGAVACWGANWYGELGDGTTVDSTAPVAVRNVVDATQLEAGELHTCALRATHQVVCWGYNSYGELGDGSFVDSSIPVAVSGLSDAVEIAAGDLHTCALRQNGASRCWGDGEDGQLGDNVGSFVTTPSVVAGITGASKVASGISHSCAVRSTGEVDCWGINADGQLGNGTGYDSPSPVVVSGIGDALDLAAGSDQTCALRSSGQVACWGYGDYGQLGDGGGASATTPVTVAGIANAIAVAAGDLHSCALRGNGQVACWGSGTVGELGDGQGADSNTPVTVSGIGDAVAIAAGGSHSCAVRATGQVMCWGYGTYGQLGDGAGATSLSPVAVSNISNAIAVDVGSFHSCALLATGQVSCWGQNSFGQLGDGTYISSKTAVAVSPVISATAVRVGADHSCALLAGGAISCWGNGAQGQLGNGATGTSAIAEAVSGLSDAISIGVGYYDGCAARASGELRCWGDGSHGKLGNRHPWASTPVDVSWF